MAVIGFFIKNLALTILFEWLIARFFLHQRRNRIIVILAQVITNPIVNLCVLLRPDSISFWQIIWPLEILAVITEGLIYKRCFSETIKLPPLVFSLLSNTSSFALGLLLSNML